MECLISSLPLKKLYCLRTLACERMKWLNGSNLNKSFLLTGLWIGYHVDCIHITTLQGAVPRLYTSFGFGSKRAIVNSLNFFS